MNHDLLKEINAAITICDTNGTILEMNDKSAKTFEKDGGYNLIGKNLFACHSERSQNILHELIENQRSNIYTIEKNGIKKLIYQTPWYENGKMKGMAEISIEIPFEMPHFIR